MSLATAQGAKPATHPNTVTLRWILSLTALCLVIEVIRLIGAGSASGDLGALNTRLDELTSENQALHKQLEAAQTVGNAAMQKAEAAQTIGDSTKAKLDRVLADNETLMLHGPGKSLIQMGFDSGGSFLQLSDVAGTFRVRLGSAYGTSQQGRHCLVLAHSAPGATGWYRCDDSTD